MLSTVKSDESWKVNSPATTPVILQKLGDFSENGPSQHLAPPLD